jgi:hypothetical protein
LPDNLTNLAILEKSPTATLHQQSKKEPSVMRGKRTSLSVLGGLLLLVLGPAVFSQPEPGGAQASKGSRSGTDVLWNLLSSGKDSINVSEVVFPPALAPLEAHLKEEMLSFLQSKGITNGIMTRELYLLHREEKEQHRHARLAHIESLRTQRTKPADDPLPEFPSRPGRPVTQQARAAVEEQPPVVYRTGKLPSGCPSGSNTWTRTKMARSACLSGRPRTSPSASFSPWMPTAMASLPPKKCFASSSTNQRRPGAPTRAMTR